MERNEEALTMMMYASDQSRNVAVMVMFSNDQHNVLYPYPGLLDAYSTRMFYTRPPQQRMSSAFTTSASLR